MDFINFLALLQQLCYKTKTTRILIQVALKLSKTASIKK
jgi:hypothetical protein